MASSLIRFRRALKLLPSLHQSFSTTATPFSVTIRGTVSSPGSLWESLNVGVQSRSFRSSSISLLSARFSQPQTNIPDEIGPDTVLFEGCDYNHWLIVTDFPKDNQLTAEEKVRFYEETCAKGLNISVEEAKKKMYACSTTVYTGFQAVMTEEESKKFEGLPGVIFVLPDSYIDPVNKEYGGDKYIDGTIIPRPPPVHYGRNQGGRNQGRRDWNRGPDQYNQQENPMANPRGNPSYNNRGSAPGDGRNYGPQQGYPPQQNYGQAPQPGYPPQQTHGQASQSYPPKQNYGPASQNYPPQQNFNQTSQNYPPQQSQGQASPSYPPKQNYGQAAQSYPPQQNFNQASQNYSPPHQTYGSASPQYGQQQSFGPPGQSERRNFAPQQNFGPPGQGVRRDPASSEGGWNNSSSPSYMKGFQPSYMKEFEQAEQGNHPAKEQRYQPPGQGNFAGEGRY